MKKLLLAFVVLMSLAANAKSKTEPVVQSIYRPAPGTSIVLPRSGTSISLTNGVTNAAIYATYDTLKVNASLGNYDIMYIDSLIPVDHDIWIININGNVNFQSNATCIKLTNCRRVHILGIPYTLLGQYGFNCTSATQRGGVGVEVTERSEYCSFENIYVYNKAYAFWAKNEVICKTNGNGVDTAMGDWNLDNITISYCKGENLGYLVYDSHGNVVGGSGQFLYGGSTDVLGISHRSYTCGATTTTSDYCAGVHPSFIGNIKVSHCIGKGSERNFVQISGCIKGIAIVEYCDIDSSGWGREQGQKVGIYFGTMTRGIIRYNHIHKVGGQGIFALGSGNVEIYGNLIDSCGSLNGGTENNVSAITVDTRSTVKVINGIPQACGTVDSTQFNIHDNVIGINTGYDIQVLKTHATYNVGNIICNNTKAAGGAASINVASGIDYTTTCSAPVNLPPVINAGQDTLINIPVDSIYLTGTAVDVDGSIATYHWTKVSGPDSFTISTADSATTWIKNLVRGNYVFRFTVTDNSAASVADDVAVTVKKCHCRIKRPQ